MFGENLFGEGLVGGGATSDKYEIIRLSSPIIKTRAFTSACLREVAATSTTLKTVSLD